MGKNAAYLVTGRTLVSIMGWAGTVVIARVLSPTAWGEYSLIFSIMGAVGLMADLQLGRTVLRDLIDAGSRLPSVLGSFVTLRLVVGLASYLVAVAVVVVIGYPPVVVEAMAVSATVLVVAAVGAALYIYLTSQMWMAAQAVSSVLGQGAQLGLTLGLVAAGYRNLVVLVVPAVLFEIVALGWQLRVARRHTPIRLAVDRSHWGTWLGESGLLAVGVALGSLYMRIDAILLSKLGSLRAVGLYAVGNKFAYLAASVASAVASTVLVVLTRSWPEDPARFIDAFRRGLLLLLVMGVAMAVEFGALAAPIIRALYGPRFGVGSQAAIILVVAQLFTFFTGLCFVVLVAIRHNLPYLVAAVTGLVVNVALNIVLIPRWSYTGVAVATMLTEALVLGVLVWALARLVPLGAWLPWRFMARVSLAGGAMAAAAFLVRGHVPWAVDGAVAGVIYLAVIHLTSAVGPGGLRALLR